MKKNSLIAYLTVCCLWANAQSTTVTSWLINTTGQTGSHYEEGNGTPIADTDLVNVQTVCYNTNFAFISSTGVPAYIWGPFTDGNPSWASDNEHIFKIPLNPVEQTGTKTGTSPGIIAVFINGVPIYDWRDAMSYNNQGVWNRDAVVNEMDGFDCPKGHPGPIFSGGGGPGPGATVIGGTYHHHQNPTAFDLDMVVVSDICDTYPSDGLYIMDDMIHSPLLGYSFDGFPIYGAYGYDNADGTGGVVRIESSYALRNITVRTHYADGSDVTDGPVVSSTYPLGTYKEDYEFSSASGHLDEYNGRIAVTPEYPGGIYAYYTTVDQNENSQFPYIIGPDEYYGEVNGGEVNFKPNNVVEYVQIVVSADLLNFGVELKEKYVNVNWEVAHEINCDRYEIERSKDMSTFENIGAVDVSTHAATNRVYNFEDIDYLNGRSYYRLKLIDMDGTYTYSDLASIATSDYSMSLNVFPNPSSDFVSIQAKNLVKNKIQIDLYNAEGVFIAQQYILQGSTIANFDTRRLYSGNYYMIVTDEYGFTQQYPIVLSK